MVPVMAPRSLCARAVKTPKRMKIKKERDPFKVGFIRGSSCKLLPGGVWKDSMTRVRREYSHFPPHAIEIRILYSHHGEHGEQNPLRVLRALRGENILANPRNRALVPAILILLPLRPCSEPFV